ncbi:MAG: Mrp/NBP35 family ATP-binding protein [Alphaproteobacteria bacterium]
MTRRPDEKMIWSALRAVNDDEKGKDIVSLSMVSGLQIGDNGEVVFLIEVDPDKGMMMEPLRARAEAAVKNVKGVSKVSAILTAAKADAESKPNANAVHNSLPDPHGMNKNPPLNNLPIKKIIAVASGKGGVGKSTLALNIAAILAKNGHKTGLLDADIYGPSVPMMSGLAGTKPDMDESRMIIPPEAHGMKIMSIGFMVEAEKALVWRGPMVQSALYQLFRDVKWGTKDDPLDVLVVDMPPGTGDAQLTLAQKVPVDGAVIVSTPQDIALIDARKGIEMFKKVGVPILGLIENMSTHICSNCGHEDHIFGHGGAEEEARKIGVPFLGGVPLNRDIREKSDGGSPVFDDNFYNIVNNLTKNVRL